MIRRRLTQRWFLATAVFLLVAVGACTSASKPRDVANRKLSKGMNGETPKGWFEAACNLSLSLLERTERGYWPGRGPDLTFIPYGGNPFGNFSFSTTHSGPWPFLQRVPLVLYGPGFIRSHGLVRLDREVTLADVVPTFAKLLGIRPPRTAVGHRLNKSLLLSNGEDRSPRLIATVVWDGGGWNVLNKWRGSWPFLASIMRRGTSVANATVGSSPSITPAVHATLGTGAFPDRHGIVNILQREGSKITASFKGVSPEHLEVKTLADVFDLKTGNQAKVATVAKHAFHLGMMGHGAYLPGGDHDAAVLTEGDGGSLLSTNQQWYSLPRYLMGMVGIGAAVEAVDRRDGSLDGRWMGHDLPDDLSELRSNVAPVMTLLQTDISKRLMATEGFGRDNVPDLFFTNYKDIDQVGHAFNFYRPEVQSAVELADDALENLVEFLDRSVGERRWVLLLTADHGQAPLPQEKGDWPIQVGNLTRAVGEFTNQKRNAVIDHIKQNGIWFDMKALRATGASLREVSDFLLSYSIGDNAQGVDVPRRYSRRLDEPVFEAAFPSAKLPRILRCAKSISR